MPKVRTEQLKPGMLVAADVKNLDNMLLMPAGCELSAKHIGILEAWGITEIEVQACEGAEESGDILQKLDPEVLAKITAELKAIFWEPVEANPIQTKVFELVLQRRARQLNS